MAHLASPLMNATELVVFHFQCEDDVVVKAKPNVGGAPSRVEVTNYFNVRVAYHFAVCSREFKRKHLLALHSITFIIIIIINNNNNNNNYNNN